ncbi:MAG: SprT family zinc-dependent metalloprotease [Pseudohongiella sp.]|nr:SprT family zinc-dependent metalloprotease [Pseudohongiella sp.]
MLFGKHYPELETLDVEGLQVVCQLHRSKRKTLALHVRHDRVEVRAPLHTSTSDVLRFLDKHQRWLTRKLEERLKRAAERLSLHDGGHIHYKARTLSICLENAPQPAVIIEPARMIIRGPAMTPVKAEQVLKNWLLAQAKNWLPARTRALADYLGVNNKLAGVVFRKTRSKWGHCTAKGIIQYNWLIMLAPDGVIDYMICHEVCHLLHMNHSPQYWQSVARVCPDYQRYVGWLKQHEHQLWF